MIWKRQTTTTSKRRRRTHIFLHNKRSMELQITRSRPAGALEAPKSFCVLTHCLEPSKGAIPGFCDTSIFMEIPKFGHGNYHSKIEARDFHKYKSKASSPISEPMQSMMIANRANSQFHPLRNHFLRSTGGILTSCQESGSQ